MADNQQRLKAAGTPAPKTEPSTGRRGSHAPAGPAAEKAPTRGAKKQESLRNDRPSPISGGEE